MAGLMVGWLVNENRKRSEDSGRYAVVDFRLLLGLFVSVSNNKNNDSARFTEIANPQNLRTFGKRGKGHRQR